MLPQIQPEGIEDLGLVVAEEKEKTSELGPPPRSIPRVPAAVVLSHCSQFPLQIFHDSFIFFSVGRGDGWYDMCCDEMRSQRTSRMNDRGIKPSIELYIRIIKGASIYFACHLAKIQPPSLLQLSSGLSIKAEEADAADLTPPHLLLVHSSSP